MTDYIDKYGIKQLADECYPDVTFGANTGQFEVRTTPEQRAAIFRKWKQNDNSMSWRDFAASVVQFDYDAVGVQWCGMFLGIEKDGYTHS